MNVDTKAFLDRQLLPAAPPAVREMTTVSERLRFVMGELIKGEGTDGSGQCIGHLGEVLARLNVLRSQPMQLALADVMLERSRQQEKWGEQDHDPMTWLAILGEEVGEACEAALHTKFGGPAAGKLRLEMIQVAAVAVQIIEWLDRPRD